MELESKLIYTVSRLALRPNPFIIQVFPACLAPSMTKDLRFLLSFHAITKITTKKCVDSTFFTVKNAQSFRRLTTAKFLGAYAIIC